MMVIKMKNKLFFSAFIFGIFTFNSASFAENIAMNTARMQAMDKITGRVSVIDVPVNGKVDFGSFSIIARSCQTRSAEEIPDSFAFIDVADSDLNGNLTNIFRGWMIASSPATNAVEHPIYDVWLLSCINKKTDNKLLLSDKELAERNNLPAALSSEKHKSVTNKINEMQYQNEQSEDESQSDKNSDYTTLEFETDEEADIEDTTEDETATADLENNQTSDAE